MRKKLACSLVLAILAVASYSAPIDFDGFDDYSDDYSKRAYHMSPQFANHEVAYVPMYKRSWNGIPMFKRGGFMPMFKRGFDQHFPMFKRYSQGFPMFRRSPINFSS